MTSHEPRSFAPLIQLKPVAGEPGVFVGPRSPERERSPEDHAVTFGGHFLGQGLRAAQLTVADRNPVPVVHSLQAYFLRGGDPAAESSYDVEAVRDGRSFASRQVSASQDGREMFRMTASFQVPEDGFDYQIDGRYPIESVPTPAQVQVTYTDSVIEQSGGEPGPWNGADHPMELLYINPPPPPSVLTPITEPQLVWMRVEGGLGNDPAEHTAALAYLADATLIDHVLLPHGKRWYDTRANGTSLDHTMWFHRPARADEWLLYDQSVISTGGGRGLATGRFYDTDGVLIATCNQEGLMRWSEA